MLSHCPRMQKSIPFSKSRNACFSSSIPCASKLTASTNASSMPPGANGKLLPFPRTKSFEPPKSRCMLVEFLAVSSLYSSATSWYPETWPSKPCLTNSTSVGAFARSLNTCCLKFGLSSQCLQNSN